MKKSKGQTVDLFYMNKENFKNTKNKKDKKSSAQKNKKNKPKSNKTETIDLDNEIIIGLTPKKNEVQKVKNKKQKKDIKRKEKKEVKSNKQKNKKKKKIKSKKEKMLRIVVIIILLVIAIIMFMMSSLFNIKQIVVENNSKISADEIILLSELTTGTNMFKISSNIINNKIKRNAYIESAKIKRKLNGKVTIQVEERVPTYMLQFGNSYVYINNQGYMLEISETKIDFPIIIGYETNIDQIKEGNRLIVNDLKKLEDIIKIIESSKKSALKDVITTIDMGETDNYKITIESEGKLIHFGKAENINVKLLKIEEVMKQEKGILGEIYFQDSEKTVFKEMVSF